MQGIKLLFYTISHDVTTNTFRKYFKLTAPSMLNTVIDTTSTIKRLSKYFNLHRDKIIIIKKKLVQVNRF